MGGKAGGPDGAGRFHRVISGNHISGIIVGGTRLPGYVIQGNFIGTDVTGSVALGNATNGIDVFNGTNVAIGGTTPGARNIISGNTGTYHPPGYGPIGFGIVCGSSDCVIQGNYIGTDVTGTMALGNVGGVSMGGGNTQLGGTTASARNLISGNWRGDGGHT